MRRLIKTISLILVGGGLLITGIGPVSAGIRQLTDPASKTVRNSNNRTLVTAQVKPISIQQESSSAQLTGISMSWFVMPGGGLSGGASSAFGLGGSAGQAFAGRGTNTTNALGIGFWHGVETCDCTRLADFDDNGFYDSLDLNALIDALFFGAPNPQDPGCPTTRADLNCDSSPDSIDLNYMIDMLFFGGPAPCNPCTSIPL